MCLEQRPAGSGRLALRYLGTEPLARVMIEGTDRAYVETLPKRLAGVFEAKIGESKT